jgi:FKBP-type peptidyl-prolyl cis-trans isomerase SlyD
MSEKRIVNLDYELRIEGGKVIESSKDRGTLAFVSGMGQLLPALEKRIDKLQAGQEESGVLPAAEAFGDESLIPLKEIARSEFPAGEKLEVGRIFQAGTAAGGEPVRFKIVESGDQSVKVRFLHALHDANIAYTIKIVSVQKADRPPPPPGDAMGIDSTAILVSDDK